MWLPFHSLFIVCWMSSLPQITAWDFSLKIQLMKMKIRQFVCNHVSHVKSPVSIPQCPHSLTNTSFMIQAVGTEPHFSVSWRNYPAHLKAVYLKHTGEELRAQLWRLPVESMSRSVFMRRWHQQGQLPASCYGCRSLGDCSEEHHWQLHTHSADANTQTHTGSWAIHRYRPYRVYILLIYFMLFYISGPTPFQREGKHSRHLSASCKTWLFSEQDFTKRKKERNTHDKIKEQYRVHRSRLLCALLGAAHSIGGVIKATDRATTMQNCSVYFTNKRAIRGLWLHIQCSWTLLVSSHPDPFIMCDSSVSIVTRSRRVLTPVVGIHMRTN